MNDDRISPNYIKQRPYFFRLARGLAWLSLALVGALADSFATDTTPPTSPGTLIVKYVGLTSAYITWTASSDNVAVANYEVFRGTTSAGTTTTTGKLVGGLTASTGYNLTVRAIDTSGNRSEISAPIHIMTSPSVSQGGDHSLAVKEDGTVWAWGGNTYGQLGDGSTTNRHSAVQVSGLTSVTQVAAGDRHSMALKSDGTVWTWGLDNYASVGSAEDEGVPYSFWIAGNRTTPAQVLSGVVAIAAGNDFSLALKSNGTVWAQGRNEYGMIGNNGVAGSINIDRETWTQTTNSSLASSVVAIAAGSMHALALKSDGTVWGWGINSSGELGDNSQTQRNNPVQVINTNLASGVVAIAAGGSHGLALKSDGTVWAWGYNGYGQLGKGNTTTYLTPQAVNTPPTGVVSIGAGLNHSLAVKSDGTVWSWGYNSAGQLGDNSTTNRNSPVQVYNFTGGLVVGTGSSGQHTLAVKTDGTVRSWGYGLSGQLGHGSGTSQQTTWVVVTNMSAVDITAPNVPTTLAAPFVGPTSVYLTWAAASDNVAVTKYEVFRGTTSMGTTTSTNKMVTGLAAGAAYRLSVRAADGSGNWSDVSLPLQVTAAPSVAQGGSHSLSVKADGSVWAWGANSYGQLGDGTTTQRTGSVQVNGIAGVIQVAAGYRHSIALNSDGTVSMWGFNPFYSYDGSAWTGINRTTPVQVSTASGVLTGVIAIAAGNDFSVALKSDGTVWAWGRNDYGQMGNNNSGSYPSFSWGGHLAAQVTNTNLTSAVVGIASGEQHVMALKSDGTVWAWGRNDYGQLGDNSTIPRTTPVQVVSASFPTAFASVVAIAGGSLHSLALKSDGTMWSWGNDSYGQLGNGSGNGGNQAGAVSTPPTGVVSIGAGQFHSLAVKSDGTVWAWGYNANGQLGDNSTTNRISPVQVSGPSGSLTGGVVVATGANSSHSLAVKSDGTAQSWGLNANGQLGNGSTSQQTTFVAVTGMYIMDTTAPGAPASLTGTFVGPTSVYLTWTPPSDNVAVTNYEIFRGTTSVGTISTASKVIGGLSASSGYSFTVRAGDSSGNWSLMSAPLQVTTAPSVAQGGSHSLNVNTDGTVWSWGANGYGQLGDGTATDRTNPVQVSGLTGAAQVAAGTSHSLALKSDGTVWMWGYDRFNTYVSGAWTSINRTTPVQVSTSSGVLTDVIAIAAGNDFSVALKSNGTVWTWGRNDNGQMGNNSSASYPTSAWNGGIAAQVTNTNLASAVMAIAAGEQHAIAVKSDGTVWSWGRNDYGQLGDNSTTQRTAPAQVVNTNLNNAVVAVAGGQFHSLALKTDGTVWTWGRNDYGQLGDGNSPTQRNFPVQATNTNLASAVISIGAGQNHSLAVKNDGTVWSWGRNTYGQLGDTTTAGRTSPVQASGITTGLVAATGVSISHSLAAKTDGSVWASGENTNGQLGDTTIIQRNSFGAANGILAGDTTPPSSPTSLQATNVTSTTLTFGWSAATDNVGVTGYQVFSGATSFGTTTGLSMPITGLDALTYGVTLEVRAFDAASNLSAPAGLTVSFSDTAAPTAPPSVSYVDLKATSVVLFWSASNDNIGVTGYKIYRGGSLIGTTTGQTYADSGLTASTAYAYTVKALDAATNLSSASTTLDVTTTADFSVDADHDGIPDAVETALITPGGTAANPDTANQTQQVIHRPVN